VRQQQTPPSTLPATDTAALIIPAVRNNKLPHGERVVTGHIDFLQVRNGAIHLLDYKPDTTTNKPFAQLTIHALALSYLTDIPLLDFKCALFNEHQYCEVFPRTILARNAPTGIKERAA
jgi:hypothetical protein